MLKLMLMVTVATIIGDEFVEPAERAEKALAAFYKLIRDRYYNKVTKPVDKALLVEFENAFYTLLSYLYVLRIWDYNYDRFLDDAIENGVLKSKYMLHKRGELMSLKMISNLEELLPALYDIGNDKNMLPVELRGWVNALGLYVQTWLDYPGQDCRESLAAGGKYRKYLYATCYYDLSDGKHTDKMVAAGFGDFNHWNIKKFDREVWEKRFAHLVEPTREIAWYLSTPDKQNSLKAYGSKSDI